MSNRTYYGEGADPDGNRTYFDELESDDIKRAIEKRLKSPNARAGEPSMPHVRESRCLVSDRPVCAYCSCWHCTICVCGACGAYEGGLTTECPGECVDVGTTLAVYKAKLDYTVERGWHLLDESIRTRQPLFTAPTKNQP